MYSYVRCELMELMFVSGIFSFNLLIKGGGGDIFQTSEYKMKWQQSRLLQERSLREVYGNAH